MASIVVSGDTSGAVTITAPAIAGTTTLTLPTTSGTIVTTGGAASLTTSGNLTFTGTGNRIIGDFSNATHTNRVLFQTSTTNGSTIVGFIPNGTGSVAQLNLYNNSDPTNTGLLQAIVGTGEVSVRSGITGTGTYLPLTMYTGGGERLRIDTSGNVGIGTAAPPQRLTSWTGGTLPSVIANCQLLVGDTSGFANAGLALVTNASNASSITFGSTASPTLGRIEYDNTNNYMRFLTNGANERMRITSAGDVGIGTSSPSARLEVAKASGASDIRLSVAGSLYANIYASSSDFTINSVTAIPLTFGTNNTERMRITSGGELLIDTTTSQPYVSTSASIVCKNNGSRWALTAFSDTTSLAYLLSFVNPNGQVGRIETNGSSTAYSTSSDYRLKENIAPMTGALEKVQQLKPCTYTWKVDGSTGEGFIAHELAEVCPDAVSGEKDAVDADGNPKYQGVDTSFLVATLTAAIQELNAKVEAQAAEIAALKGVK